MRKRMRIKVVTERLLWLNFFYVLSIELPTIGVIFLQFSIKIIVLKKGKVMGFFIILYLLSLKIFV